MKTNKYLITTFAALSLASASYAQTVINITGATAFRAAAHNSIIAVLGGAGTTSYAFTGTQGIGGANRAIFKGTVAGIGPVTVRASWSGSTGGIAAVAAGTPVELLVNGTTTSTAGINETSPVYESQPASFTFSDVSQASSTTLSPVLTGTQVGVVPFSFLTNASAPAGLNNMTDQVMKALYSTASVPLRAFTGVAGQNTPVYATGRNASSGTRAAVLAETGYGTFSSLQQFTGVRDAGTNAITSLTFVGNGGYSSNSGIRDLLLGTSTAVSVEGGAPESAYVVGYLTISDFLAATTGAGTAKPMSYNGVAYSEDAVKQGSYSLWAYQWFYQAPTITAAETTFRNTFVAAIPANLGTAAIPIPDMTAIRSGGDGGPISP